MGEVKIIVGRPEGVTEGAKKKERSGRLVCCVQGEGKEPIKGAVVSAGETREKVRNHGRIRIERCL